MARTSNITFAQVAQIADTMKAAGHRPTARAVRERIGSGSMGTVHKLLQQWAGRANVENEDDDAPELPSSIASILMDFVTTQVAEACEPINDELQDAKEAADALAEHNERLTAELAAADATATSLREKIAGMDSTVDMLKAKISHDAETADQYQAIIDDMKTELNRLRERDRQAEEIRGTVGGLRDRIESMRDELAAARETAAVATAQREAATAKADDKTAQLAKTEKMLEIALADAKQANRCTDAANARLEAAAREIEDLRKKAAPRPATTPKKTSAKTTTEAAK